MGKHADQRNLIDWVKSKNRTQKHFKARYHHQQDKSVEPVAAFRYLKEPSKQSLIKVSLHILTNLCDIENEDQESMQNQD